MTTTETVEPNGLTAVQVKALRHASSVCFDYLGDSNTYQIRCFKRIKDSGFEYEAVVTVPATGTITCYNEDSRKVVGAYASSLSAQYDSALRTVFSLIKVGDRLALRFLAGNNTETLAQHGLACDELQLVVRRGEGPKSKTLTFNIDHRICPTHSSARMVVQSI